MSFPPPNYVYCAVLQQYFVDKDSGQPLSGGYINFYNDIPSERTIPKDVFVQQQQPDSSYVFTNIGSTVGLSSVGTTQYLGTDTIIFLYPFDANGNEQLYYIEVFSSAGVLQFTREAWPPNVSASFTPTTGSFVNSENVVSNPQFAEVLFAPAPATSVALTIGGAQTLEIAPDWSIITTGAGTLTLTQVAETDTGAPGLPAFGLEVSLSGFAGPVVLSQTISQSPRLLEDGFASGTFIAKSNLMSPIPITMNFVPSNPSMPPVEIASGSATVGAYALISGTAATPSGGLINGDSGLTGYVQVQFSIPAGADIIISCVQLISVAAENIVANYIQESTPRQQDHLFHYWQPILNFKPIPSLLTAWDFASNPLQFGITSFSTTPIYVWDQTICASANSTINVLHSGSGAFQATTTADTEAFYMLQYLTGASAAETALGYLSVNLFAYQEIHPGVVARVYLYSGNGSSSIPSLSTTIGTIANTGVFTLTASNWSLISQIHGESNQTSISTAPLDYGFTGFNQIQNFGSVANFAIVVTFVVPTAGTEINVQSISCVPGRIPTRPAPQSADEVLRECQFYYETSDTNGVSILMNSSFTASTIPQLYASPFTITYNTIKRAVPNFTVASLTPTAANVSATIYYNVTGTLTSQGPTDKALATYWTAPVVGQKSLFALPNSVTPLQTYTGATASYNSGSIQFTYALDARLGVV